MTVAIRAGLGRGSERRRRPRSRRSWSRSASRSPGRSSATTTRTRGSSSSPGCSRPGSRRSCSPSRSARWAPRGRRSRSGRRRFSRSRSRSSSSTSRSRTPLVIGALAIVAGGVVLVGERGRPDHLRRAGARSSRSARRSSSPCVTTSSAPCTRRGAPRRSPPRRCWRGWRCRSLATRTVPSRHDLRLLAPAGVLFGCSYLCLFEAYFHGRVSIVSPLIATESLWGVGIAALVFPHTEAVGRRLVARRRRDRLRRHPDRARGHPVRICYKHA